MSLLSTIGDICKVAVHVACQIYLPGPAGAAVSMGIGAAIDGVTDDPEEGNQLDDPGVADFAQPFIESFQFESSQPATSFSV